ncbi:TraB/GumN family protein [Herbivorax sp. ANBcel31]|uniref:TraB/GumN family protein n=1 Tax=Herbivorax sp. ANBcel31 TaxID=3069754 RepID=UPI0027B2A593|nr:TraB/GumN family protein [Herbivorax sp. ANBcel31]MDQ2085156.1 TraB/GumN family protein [Herbivorax sp. ANBcel31]
MKKTKRVTALLLAVVMVISLQITGIFAQQSLEAEQPSIWALEGVQWSAIYELAQEEMYTNYTSKVTCEELATVSANLYKRITGEEISPSNLVELSEPQRNATRLEMVEAVYSVIKKAQPDFDFEVDVKLTFEDVNNLSEDSLSIIKYSVSRGILNGRNNKILDLATVCTRQELMVYAKNAYEFVVYEAGLDSKGAFWEVSYNDNTVYLLGSVHYADSSMYPLSKDILNAFEASDILAVEADLGKVEEAATYMMLKGMYQDENTLDQNVPEEVYERFVEVIQPFGLQEEFYNKLKPWYAALLITSLSIEENNYSADMGIDLFFTSKAMEAKEIIEIEGMEFQVDMFDSFSEELQLEFFKGTLGSEEEQEEGMKLLDDIMAYWKSGNVEDLAKLVRDNEDDEDLQEFNEKMWEERDNNMTEKIKEYLVDSQNTYFVVVGAGHMIGDTGIITQLEAEGIYEITQVK